MEKKAYAYYTFKRRGKMKRVSAGIGVLAFLICASALAGDFPDKPLELVVPFVAGGSSDLMCRTMVARAAPILNNQPVVVVNKAGAGTVAASKYVLDGKNDGYTLYNISTSSMMVAPLVHKTNFSWRDFIGLGQVISEGDALFVRTDTPYTTMDKFLEYAKQNPGKIKYATSGAGGSSHLSMEGLAAVKGISIKHIPTKGNAETVAAILGGHVTVAAGNPVAFRPHEDAGKLKCLAQFGHKRDMNFVPNVPTFKEQGIDVVVDLWRWIVVPKGTPPERVKILSAALKNILHDKPTVAAMEKIGCFVSYLPPEDYEKTMKASEETITKLVKLAGLDKK
jgi:tripartite-type tricarboxylate transporter receptor subunit TctC